VPVDCQGSPSDRYNALVDTEQKVVKAKGVGFDYVATEPWFCSAAGRCPAFIGDNPVLVDGGHLTDVFAKKLGPVLQTVLGPDG